MNLLTYSNVNFSGGINTINNGVQLFKPFVVNHKTLGPLTLKISKEPSLVNGYDITVSDKFKKVLGHEAFSVLPEHKMIVGQMVEVLSEYRKQGRRKGFNLGELLHLSLIKFMNDNDFNKMDLHSKASAVYFHSKYKFEPSIVDKFDGRKVLSSIVKDKAKGFEKFVAKAQELLDVVKINCRLLCENDVFKSLNKLTKEYIEKSVADKNSNQIHSFEGGFGMTLLKENIKREADFFNKLYKKHGINYSVL
ncbi:MAG: hypothetical protein E7Z87_00570 [Cyanobacteria bacterium SIG26]|nr:hypothetical protein [Cyanobacteria bacterium SIG26]